MRCLLPLFLGVSTLLVAVGCSEPASTDGNTGGAGMGGNDGLGGNVGIGGSSGTGIGGVAGDGVGGSLGGAGAGGGAGMAGAGVGGMAGTNAAGASGAGGVVGGAGGDAAGGTAGSAGSGGMPVGSPGCGMPNNEDRATWVSQPAMTIQGQQRSWWTWIPETYDPMRAYPVVVLLHGCTGDNNNVPVQNYSQEDAILVRGRGEGNNVCWDVNAAAVEFFDGMVDAMLANYCADESRVFAAGYSSGSWLISRLNCERADRLRAVGTVAGGNQGGNDADRCNGGVAAIFVHDENDGENAQSGSISVRERLLQQNGCEMTTVPEDPPPCVRYQGCPENPVKWCSTVGEGHSRQDQYAGEAFWNFFSEF